MKDCKLCGKLSGLTKHHLIPKAVFQKFPTKKEQYSKLVIYLCNDCHNLLHNHFIEHIIMEKKYEGLTRFDAFKYLLLKEIISNKYPNIWTEWKKQLNDFIQKEHQEMDKEDETRPLQEL